MAKETLIQKGFIFQMDPTKVANGVAMFSFDKWLKRMLRKLGVQFEDCCEQATPTGFSVRLSADKTNLEYFDSADFTWKDSGLI
jgi:hypothetical protein